MTDLRQPDTRAEVPSITTDGTSTAAVERLIARTLVHLPDDAGISATLRALTAERDALAARVEELEIINGRLTANLCHCALRGPRHD